MIAASVLTRNVALNEFAKKFRTEVTAAVLKVARSSVKGK